MYMYVCMYVCTYIYIYVCTYNIQYLLLSAHGVQLTVLKTPGSQDPSPGPQPRSQ